jgi:hypothetical protein
MRSPLPSNRLVQLTLLGALLTATVTVGLAMPTTLGSDTSAQTTTGETVDAGAPTPNQNFTPAMSDSSSGSVGEHEREEYEEEHEREEYEEEYEREEYEEEHEREEYEEEHDDEDEGEEYHDEDDEGEHYDDDSEDEYRGEDDDQYRDREENEDADSNQGVGNGQVTAPGDA